MKPTSLGRLGVYSAYTSFLAIAVTAYRVGFAPAGPVTTLKSAVPAALVVTAALAQYYALLFTQSTTAFAELSRLRRAYKERGEKPPVLSDVKYGNSKTDLVRAADRCMGNYLEQLLPFLVALAAHAAFVSANAAAVVGWLWLVFRLYYPLVYSRPFPGLLISTVPAYWCVWYLLGHAMHAAAAM